MILLPMALLMALDACPKVWVMDFSALPVNSPAPYTFKVRLALGNGDSGAWGYEANTGSTPKALWLTVYADACEQFRPGWKVDQDGLTLVFREAGSKPFRRISVEGDGPKPTVRWEFAPAPKK